MKTGLKGLNVMITGAAGGIGQALAHAFAQEGCDLSLHLGREKSGRSTAWCDGLREAGTRVHAWEADVRDPAAMDAGFAAAESMLGRLDVCVVNAGIWPEESTPLHAQTVARIRDVVDTNLLGAMWTANAFARALAKAGPRPDGVGASLCFIGSTAGRFGEAGHAAYATTKAAMVGLLRSLKNEYVVVDPYARVNMVEPGWTVTPMARAALDVEGTIPRVVATMPLHQLARPEDIAGAVLMLSAPRLSRHISGEIITVAGGMEGRQLWSPEDVRAPEVRARLDPDPSD